MSPPCQRHTIPQETEISRGCAQSYQTIHSFCLELDAGRLAYICLGGAILEDGIRATIAQNAPAILCGSKETAEFYRERRHCHDSMYRTAPFQNPATARTAGSCERTGATKAPVLSPAAPFVPRKASRGRKQAVSALAEQRPKDWPETAGRGRDAVPPRRRAHSRSHGQTGEKRTGGQRHRKFVFLCIAYQELTCGRSRALRSF